MQKFMPIVKAGFFRPEKTSEAMKPNCANFVEVSSDQLLLVYAKI